MARRGDAVENPLTGERVTFLETVGDTGGDLLRFEYVGAPKHLLRLAVLASEAKEDFYFMQRHIQASLALFGALGSLGRLLGYEASREAPGQERRARRLSPEAAGGVALAAALALLVLRRRGRLRTR